MQVDSQRIGFARSTQCKCRALLPEYLHLAMQVDTYRIEFARAAQNAGAALYSLKIRALFSKYPHLTMQVDAQRREFVCGTKCRCRALFPNIRSSKCKWVFRQWSSRAAQNACGHLQNAARQLHVEQAWREGVEMKRVCAHVCMCARVTNLSFE